MREDAIIFTSKILEFTGKYPNNYSLGENVRRLVNKSKDGFGESLTEGNDLDGEEITIIDLNHHNGERTEISQMYFKTQERAEIYLTSNGYKPDDIFGWKKDYFETAKTKQIKLH